MGPGILLILNKLEIYPNQQARKRKEFLSKQIPQKMNWTILGLPKLRMMVWTTITTTNTTTTTTTTRTKTATLTDGTIQIIPKTMVLASWFCTPGIWEKDRQRHSGSLKGFWVSLKTGPGLGRRKVLAVGDSLRNQTSPEQGLTSTLGSSTGFVGGHHQFTKIQTANELFYLLSKYN